MNKTLVVVILLAAPKLCSAQKIVRSGNASIRNMCISESKLFFAATNAELYEIQVMSRDTAWGINIGTEAGGIRGLAFSPDEKSIALGTYSGVLEIWKLQGPQKLFAMEMHRGQLNDINYSLNGEKLVTCGNDSTIKVLTVKNYHSQMSINCGTKIMALARHPKKENTFVAAGHNGELLWVDVESGKISKRLNGHSSYIFDVIFDEDGHFMYSAGNDNLIKKWDVEKGMVLTEFTGHTKGVFSIDISPNGYYLVSASMDKTIKVFDVAKGSEVMTLSGHKDYVMVVRFISENLLLSGSRDETLRLWNIKNINRDIAK